MLVKQAGSWPQDAQVEVRMWTLDGKTGPYPQVQELIENDQCFTTWEIDDILKISNQ